ncbi:Cell death protease, partial [Cladochytrium tenue]
TASVQSSIHVTPVSSLVKAQGGWVECSSTVYSALDDSDVPDTVQVIPRLIAAGVPVLLYDGDLDFILHYVGYERAIGNMTWGNATGLSTPVPAEPNWTPDGSSSALGRIVMADRGLTYVRVSGAGHLVPQDAPATGLALAKLLVGGALGGTYEPPAATGTPGSLSWSTEASSATQTTKSTGGGARAVAAAGPMEAVVAGLVAVAAAAAG